MSTREEGGQPKWVKVTTPLQYLALTHKQLLVFYGSVITAGIVAQRPVLAGIALVLAGLPQLSMLLLSVVDREALKALGEDANNRTAAPDAGMHPGGPAPSPRPLPSPPVVTGGDEPLRSARGTEAASEAAEPGG
ncbi:MAG TPA: hypothetical protein VFY65_08975 [Longimicrobium sp.]|nr:hypothetical protein [Longimicrobium sp.]